MSDFFENPNQYDFGYEFNYASWDEHTELTLVNVPWNSDYRDIVQMDGGLTALNAWIDDQQNVKLTNASLQKFNEGIVKIDLPLNEAMKYNFLRARNGSSPVTNTQRDYYYFVTGVRWGASNTTYLSIQLDAITTFLSDVTFGQSFVERGHIGIANENQFDAFGRDYLTVPEGLDVGGEYRIVDTAHEDVMTMSTFSVLLISAVDLTQNPGTKDDPSLTTAPGAVVEGFPSGPSFYVFPTPNDYVKFMKVFSTFPWMTQAIYSVTVIPAMSRYHAGATLKDVAPDIQTALSFDLGSIVVDGTTIDLGDANTTVPQPANFTMYRYPTGASQPRDTVLATAWRDDFLNVLDTEYRHLKKLLTFPYSLIELTTWTGKALAVRPEAWADEDATVRELAVMVPPGQRIAFIPYRYNADPSTTPGATDDNAESLDFAMTLDNFPNMPIVNDMAISFLASNAHGIPFSYSSAEWTQQRALAGAQAAYDVQNAQIGNMGRQASIANQANTDTSNLMGTTQVGNSIIGAAGSIPGIAADAESGVGAIGGIAAASTGMIQAGISASASMQAAQIANQARGNSAISDIQTAGSVRDTNNAFATMAAKGDYANAIAGIQARVQDARMTQPSISGQFGGDALNLAHNMAQISARFKLIDNAAVRRIGNYWLRYGYAINQFIAMPASLHCMTKFTYWKLSETYISQGAFPEGFKQIIRGIFEKGVTVWKNPDDIGRTQLADNQPLEGISY